ncbi:MAG: recombinase family protein [Bacillales bacterium]|nr:recombinase family protein [Bacillales bacterium]
MGKERKRKIKDGHIVVKNPLYQELPIHEITIQSGKTLYRFTGSYDGKRSLPHKVLRLMEQSPGKLQNLQAQSYKNKKTCYNPAEKWLVFENTHEAIMDADTWARVQKLRKNKLSPTRTGNKYVFRHCALR